MVILQYLHTKNSSSKSRVIFSMYSVVFWEKMNSGKHPPDGLPLSCPWFFHPCPTQEGRPQLRRDTQSQLPFLCCVGTGIDHHSHRLPIGRVQLAKCPALPYSPTQKDYPNYFWPTGLFITAYTSYISIVTIILLILLSLLEICFLQVFYISSKLTHGCRYRSCDTTKQKTAPFYILLS